MQNSATHEILYNARTLGPFLGRIGQWDFRVLATWGSSEALPDYGRRRRGEPDFLAQGCDTSDVSKHGTSTWRRGASLTPKPENHLPGCCWVGVTRQHWCPRALLRMLRPHYYPARGARCGIYLRRELQPVLVADGGAGRPDGPCTPPTRRRPNSPAVTHFASSRKRARWRCGRAPLALWRADELSIDRLWPLHRTLAHGMRASGFGFTSSFEHDLTGAS